MKNIFLILILCFLTQSVFASSAAKKEIKRGNALYNDGKFEEALKKYEDALLSFPDSDIVNFDTGTALYKIQDYERAIDYFEKSLVSENQSLEQKASYNIGNTKYKYGISKEETDLQGTVSLLKEAIHHYEHVFSLASEDKDAQYNYEFVKKELRRLEEKMKQQEQSRQDKKKCECENKEQKPGQQPAQEQEAQKETTQEKEEKSEANEKEQRQHQQSGEGEKEQQREGSDSPEENEGRQPGGEGREAQQAAGEMSEQEAEALLDSYRQEEEPKGLYREKISTRELPEVLKDW